MTPAERKRNDARWAGCNAPAWTDDGDAMEIATAISDAVFDHTVQRVLAHLFDRGVITEAVAETACAYFDQKEFCP